METPDEILEYKEWLMGGWIVEQMKEHDPAQYARILAQCEASPSFMEAVERMKNH